MTGENSLLALKGENRFYKWLSGFPEASLYRLQNINRATNSSRHIILTISYGVIDPNIRAINKMIINLLLLRMRLEKKGEHQRCERMEAKLAELHVAIDAMTGVAERTKNSHELCKSTSRKMAA